MQRLAFLITAMVSFASLTLWASVSASENAASIQMEDERIVSVGWSSILPSPVPSHETGSAEMVFVAGGTFRMGNTLEDGCFNEKPVHHVTLSGFWMGKYEVTYPLWVRVCEWANVNGYEFENEGQGGYVSFFATRTSRFDNADEGVSKTAGVIRPPFKEQPVVRINWYDMVKWCNAYSQMNGREPCYYIDRSFRTLYKAGRIDLENNLVNWSANGYRLPTEAEWEYAAKGGSSGVISPYKYSGSDEIDGFAWYYQNSGKATHPVGTRRPNQLGIYDMNGNVWEWCWDWYGLYTAEAQQAPSGPQSGLFRVLRGGCCTTSPVDLRSVVRSYVGGGVPGRHLDNNGFRVVRGSR